MPYLIMTYFAMVQNHTLLHFAIYPSSSTEEFWVFFFFSCLPSTATYMPFYLRNDCYFLWYEGGEKREGNTKKKRDLSLKRVGNNANLCINKTKSNMSNTHQNIVWGISDLPHCFPPAESDVSDLKNGDRESEADTVSALHTGRQRQE